MSGVVNFFNTTTRLVEVLLDREVRRCFNYQRHGHAQAACRTSSPRFGKCANEHRTRNCLYPQGTKKCSKHSGAHHAGDRLCPVQMKGVVCYRATLVETFSIQYHPKALNVSK